jgi:hypothetical protein
VLGRSRSWGALSIACLVFFFSLIAANSVNAESIARSADARLAVSVNVVSTCSIDSSSASPVRCAIPTSAQVTTRPVQSARAASTQLDGYTLTTINF